MKQLKTLAVIAEIALIVYPAFATTATASQFYGGTGVWTWANPPAYNPQGPGFYYNETLTSHINITVTGFVYLIAHNGVGQTVYIVECSLTLAAYATDSCADVVLLTNGTTYQASIFAVSASGIAISNSTSVTFQGNIDGP
jgi:hypothetical protein